MARTQEPTEATAVLLEAFSLVKGVQGRHFSGHIHPGDILLERVSDYLAAELLKVARPDRPRRRQPIDDSQFLNNADGSQGQL